MGLPTCHHVGARQKVTERVRWPFPQKKKKGGGRRGCWRGTAGSVKRGANAHSLFGKLPNWQLDSFAPDDEPQEIVAFRTDVRSVGIHDIVRGREGASPTFIHERLRKHDLEREHARALSMAVRVVFRPFPEVIRSTEERRLGACALWAGQVYSALQLKAHNQRRSEMRREGGEGEREGVVCRVRQRRSGTYLDEDSLHSLRTAESNISGYCTTTTIRGRRGMLVLPTQGDGNEAILPHKHTRVRPPARTRGHGKRALGWRRSDRVSGDVGRRGVSGWLPRHRYGERRRRFV